MHNTQGRHALFAIVRVASGTYVSNAKRVEKYHKNEIRNEVDVMNIFSNFNEWREYRRAVNELNALSNRELDDLGITRGEIRRVVRHGQKAR